MCRVRKVYKVMGDVSILLDQRSERSVYKCSEQDRQFRRFQGRRKS